MTWQDELADQLLHATRYVNWFNYPTSFERLDIDENQSFWASQTPDYQASPHLNQDIHCDLAIIGGGFTGVSTAYYFSEQFPDKRVVLLEAKKLANGASGRNGGMMLNWINGIEDDYGEMSQRVYTATRAGIDMIEGIIHQHGLKVSYRRDGAMTNFTDSARAEAAHEYVEKMNALGIPLKYLNRDELPLQGTYGAILDESEGQINGAQLIRALKPLLQERGVEIYEYTPVLKVREGSTITLTTPHGLVFAKAIVLATNGYSGKLGYFRKGIFPLHSHVFATEALTPEQIEALGWRSAGYSDDYDRISYSTLTKEGHIIFGGGSNASYAYLFNNKTAYPGTPATAQNAFRAMHQTMLDYLPTLRNIKITHRWTGTLGITLQRNCSIGVMGDHRNVYYGVGYCGHGVTLANLAGKIITDVYAGADEEWRKFPFYNQAFAPIPMEPFRWLGYQMTTRLTGKSPRR